MGVYTLYRAYYKQRRPSGSTQSWQTVLPLTISWTDGNGNYTILEDPSTKCGYEPQPDPIYRWVNIPINQDYDCDTTTYTKYYRQKKQVSMDNGATYNDVSPAQYQRGAAYESNSIDCGYVDPTAHKWTATYGGGTYSDTKIREKMCDGSNIIRDEIKVYYYQNVGLPTNIPITSLVIGDCVQQIGDCPFSYANNPSTTNKNLKTLTSLTIPNSVTYIGSEAFIYGSFSDCGDLSNVTYIGSKAFENCSNLTGVTFGNGLEYIGNFAFNYCSSLTSLTIPNSVTYIGNDAFGHCTGLTSVNISNAITSINTATFAFCSGLTSVTIPSSVTHIHGAAFAYCRGLTGITCLAVDPPTLSAEWYAPFLETNNCPIYVPAASVSAYQTAWSPYASRIQPIGS